MKKINFLFIAFLALALSQVSCKVKCDRDCKNGGTCKTESNNNGQVSGFTCTCLDGFEGDNCETKTISQFYGKWVGKACNGVDESWIVGEVAGGTAKEFMLGEKIKATYQYTDNYFNGSIGKFIINSQTYEIGTPAVTVTVSGNGYFSSGNPYSLPLDTIVGDFLKVSIKSIYGSQTDSCTTYRTKQ